MSDWFYLKPDICPNANMDPIKMSQCESNKTAVKRLQNSANIFGSSATQYNDAKMLYNRELLFTINMLAGLAMICYYVYVNQSAIPSPSAAVAGLGSSITSTTSSITSRLSMRPPAQA